MAWSYEKLWILLVKKKWKRTSLKTYAGISSSALAHMGKDEPVTMDVLGRICAALQCNIGDIVDYIPESEHTDSSDCYYTLDCSDSSDDDTPFEIDFPPLE